MSKFEFDKGGTRYLCDILKDMRKAYKTRNFSYLPGLIEEMQYRANRMENRIDQIGEYGGVEDLERKRIELKEEVRKLKEEKRKLRQEGDNE